MKTLSKLFAVIIVTLVAAGMNSCEINNPAALETGSFELFLNLADPDLANLKSEIPDSLGDELNRYHALLTVLDPDSMPVLEDELLPLYKFGGGFFSEKIEMKAGHYILTKFMIVDPNGEVIFAAPLKGSPKAYLVKKPLPIGFKVHPERTTRLSPEVLPVQGDPPSDFGYSTFGFVVVKPLPFYIVAIIDDPRIMAPTRFTEAKLSVFHPDGWRHSFKMMAQINRIVIRGGAEYYKFIVQKEGFDPLEMEVPAKKLMATTREDPMIVRFGPDLHHVLRLQPGPEKGFDAMISNLEPEKNFGKHPYFEATYMTDNSPLTVMRENRSLIRFSPSGLPKSAIIEKVTLTLFYDVPLPWDGVILKDTLLDAAGNVLVCAGVLEQIVEPWEEHEVIWAKQPKTNEKVQVWIKPFVKNANFIDVDVTKMFVNQFSYPSYGMLFKLAPGPTLYTDAYPIRWPGFRFTSSDFEKPEMRPMLTIHYTLPIY